MKWIVAIIGAIVIVVGGIFLFTQNPISRSTTITTFEECVEAGNPVMDSWPPQCRSGDTTFTQYIGNEMELTDIIHIDNPRPTASISSPLEVTGQARGQWYFEASFPVVLLDENGEEIATDIAQTEGEWMTEEFVPFKATLDFESPTTEKGTLILQKSNPSGLPENDAELIIPIIFTQ